VVLAVTLPCPYGRRGYKPTYSVAGLETRPLEQPATAAIAYRLPRPPSRRSGLAVLIGSVAVRPCYHVQQCPAADGRTVRWPRHGHRGPCKRTDWLCCQSGSVLAGRGRPAWRSRSPTKETGLTRPGSDLGCERRLHIMIKTAITVLYTLVYTSGNPIRISPRDRHDPDMEEPRDDYWRKGLAQTLTITVRTDPWAVRAPSAATAAAQGRPQQGRPEHGGEPGHRLDDYCKRLDSRAQVKGRDAPPCLRATDGGRSR